MRWTVVVALAVCAAACGGVDDSSVATDDAALEAAVPHVLAMGRGGERVATASSGLTYYGGPVLENASVVAVLWGASVDATVKARIGAFYKAVTGSSYFSWLSEYDTAKQHLGAGSLAGVYAIVPSHKATALSDADIQRELAAQIKKGALPAATAATVYLVHFPRGVRISLGGSSSCERGGFCGYHGSFKSGRARVRYAVVPDMSSGSGCDVGCGSGDPFGAVTSVASHELVEAVTDPDVGLARSLAAPLAWYDAANGEIGDLCAGQDGTVRAGGVTWTVQKQWSNKARACVLSVR